MITFARGDVLLVLMTFTDGSAAKKRPVMVVFDSGDDDLLVAPVTSHAARSGCDVPLSLWQQSGLRLPSIVRLEKLATVEKSTVVRRLGRIEPGDWARIKPVLARFFADLLA